MAQNPVNWHHVNGQMTDVSTASSAWVVSPCDGYIKAFYTVIATAITVADANVTLEIGGTAVTGSAIVVAQASAAAGDVDSAFPTALNYVRKGQAIEVVSDGASTTASIMNFTIVIAN
jgi:hypothetical protein